MRAGQEVTMETAGTGNTGELEVRQLELPGMEGGLEIAGEGIVRPEAEVETQAGFETEGAGPEAGDRINLWAEAGTVGAEWEEPPGETVPAPPAQEEGLEAAAPHRAGAEDLRAENLALLAQLQALYRARPDVVPELIRGNNAAELEESLGEAQAVYRRMQEQFAMGVGGQGLGVSRGEGAVIVPVAAGGGERRSARNTAGLSPVEKIAQGLRKDRI